MELPYEQMARTALELLLSGSPGPSHNPIECSLITRGSVASAKVHE